MSEHPLQFLIQLVEFDQTYLALIKEEAALQASLQEDKNEMELCRVGLEKMTHHKKDAKKEVDQHELAMKELDQQEKEIRKHLDAATNQREYDSVSREIEKIKKKQHDLEEALLASWKSYEHAEQELKSRQEWCEKKTTSLNTVIAEKMQQLHELQNKITAHRALREEKIKTIPSELLEKYETMYQRVANPIVPVLQGSCSACFYPLTQQDLLELRRGKLLQCKDCFRFLYFSAEEQ